MRRLSISKLMVAAAVAMLAACDASPTGPVFAGLLEITPAQPTFTAESAASFRLRNVSQQPVSYQTCGGYRVERFVFGMWVPAPQDPAIASCAPEPLPVVAPGETAVTQVFLSARLTPGTYRVIFLVTTHTNFTEQLEEASLPFKVRAG